MRSILFLALGGLALGLLGCAPGTDSAATIVGTSTAAKARACSDLNSDLACGPGEPTSVTRDDGSFTLPWSVEQDSSPLVVEVEGGVSWSVFDREVYPRSFPLVFSGSGAPALSVFSTLEHATVQAGTLAPDKARSALTQAFGVPSPDLVFTARVAEEGSAYEEILETSYQEEYFRALGAGASTSEAVGSAAKRMYDDAGEFAKYFERVTSHWLTSPSPTPPGSTTDQIAETHYRAVSLGPTTTFGNGLNVPARALATTSADADCVTPDMDTLQSVCFNDWSFSFEMVEDIDEVVNSLDTSLSVSASVLGIASASGDLSWEDYYRKYSDDVHILLNAEMRRCKYDLTAKMKPVWETKFGTNYDAFRAGCGDRFLSAQTTGGSFVAVFEKEIADEDERKDFKLRLKAKVLGLTVFDHTWKSSADSSLSNLGLNVRIVTDRSHITTPWTTMADVTTEFANFAKRVSSDQCSDSDGYKNCVYLSSFNLYDTTTGVPRAPSANLELLESNLYSLEQYAIDYARLRSMTDDIIAHPNSYNIGTNVDRFSHPNDWTLQKLVDYEGTLTADITSLRTKAGLCRANISSCTSTPGDLGFKGWFELADTLPSRKIHVPKDCQELSLYYGSRYDGSYTVFFNRDVTKSYQVGCSDMATSTPLTYLPLLNTSALPDQPVANYSTHAEADGTVTRTLFSALLLSDRSVNDSYQLFGTLPQDARFLTSTIPSYATDASGLAGVYNCSSATISSNLDLTGTSFALPTTVGSTLDTDADGSRVSWETADQFTLDLHLTGGGCAYLRPTPNAGLVPLLYTE